MKNFKLKFYVFKPSTIKPVILLTFYKKIIFSERGPVKLKRNVSFNHIKQHKMLKPYFFNGQRDSHEN